MYAIIKTGGKQYKVAQGDVIRVEKLEAEGDYTFTDVLAISKDGALMLGEPTIKGASVTASIVNQGKHKKVIVYKFKSKKGFHKKKGHRQPYTELKINSING